MVSRILVLYISIILWEGAGTAAQPLKGEEANRWQAACSLAQQGRLDQALQGFKSVLEERNDLNLYHQAGALLVRQGGQVQATELYLWGRRGLKQPKAFADRLAEIYQAQQKYDRAVAELMNLLPTQFDLARLKLTEIGRNIGWVKTASLVEPNIKGSGDAGWLVLGGLYLSAKDDRRAWGAFSRMRDVGRLRKAVDQMLAAGIPVKKQIEVMEHYLARISGPDLGLLEKLGRLYMEARQFTKAQDIFTRMLTLNRPLATVLSARALLKQGDHSNALAVLDPMRRGRSWPDTLRWEADMLVAQARLISGDPAAAAGAYRSMAGDTKVSIEFRQRAAFKMAEAHLMSGQVDSALADYRRVLDLGLGGDLSNDAMLRVILISEHKADKIEGLKLFGRGLMEKAGARYDPAAGSFSLVAEKYPGTTLADQALLELALMRQEQGEIQGAAGIWQRLAESAWEPALSCRASYQQGMILRYELNREEEATEVWRQAIIKHPDFSWSDLMRQELAGYNNP